MRPVTYSHLLETRLREAFAEIATASTSDADLVSRVFTAAAGIVLDALAQSNPSLVEAARSAALLELDRQVREDREVGFAEVLGMNLTLLIGLTCLVSGGEERGLAALLEKDPAPEAERGPAPGAQPGEGGSSPSRRSTPARTP